MVDLITAIPWPVWVLASAMVVIGWLWAAVRYAPYDTELWPGGEYGNSGQLDDEDESDEDDGQNDEAEPPLVPGWGEERW